MNNKKRIIALLLVLAMLVPGAWSDIVNAADGDPVRLKDKNHPEEITNSNIDLRGMFSIPNISEQDQVNEAEVLDQQPNILQLTHDLPVDPAEPPGIEEVGMAYYAYRIPINENFTFKGKIYLGDKAEEDGGGYGLTFVLHNDDLDTVGNGGGGLGVGSNTQTRQFKTGIVVEFDTHFETDTNTVERADFGQDYDIAENYNNLLSQHEHLLHTAIQALSSKGSTGYDGNSGIGDYAKVGSNKNWHRAEAVITDDKYRKEDFFGEWLDLQIDWKIENNKHVLGYKLSDTDGNTAVEEKVIIEDEFRGRNTKFFEDMGITYDVMQELFNFDGSDVYHNGVPQGTISNYEEVKHIYWGFTASNAYLASQTTKTDRNTNEHAIALTGLPLEAKAESTKQVRKVAADNEPEEAFSGSASVAVGDMVEYEIIVKPQDGTPIPLALASFYDTLETGQKLIADSIKIEKRNNSYTVSDGTISKGDPEDNGYFAYEKADGSIAFDPEAEGITLTPKYVYDEKTGELILYGLGTLGRYTDDPYDAGTKTDDEELVIRFQVEVTGTGEHRNGVIYNQGNIHSGAIENYIYTNAHLSRRQKARQGLTRDGKTQIRVHPTLELEKSIKEKVAGKEFYEGDTVTYVIKASNQGIPWVNGKITDQLPPGVSFDENDPDAVSITYYNKDGQEITKAPPLPEWSFADLGNADDPKPTVTVEKLKLGHEEYVLVEIKTQIASGAAGTTIKNIATASGESEDDPDITAEDDGDVEIEVGYKAGTLEIDKKAVKYKRGNHEAEITAQTVLKVGDEITYTVSVSNQKPGGSLVKDVKITDILPEDVVSYIVGSAASEIFDAEGTGTPGALPVYTEAVKTITAAIGDLAEGETAVLTYKVRITDEATGILTNTASAEGTEPWTNGAKIESGETEEDIEVAPDISITKTADTAVYSGSDISYSIEIGNGQGGGLWKGDITDTLNSEWADWSAMNGTLSYKIEYFTNGLSEGLEVTKTAVITNGTFKIEDLILKSNQTAVITYVVKAKALAADEESIKVENHVLAVQVDDNGQPIETSKKEDDTTTYVVPKPGKLQVVKAVLNADGESIDGKNVKTGDTIQYKITVSDPDLNPDTTVNDVEIGDSLPEGVVYVDGSIRINGVPPVKGFEYEKDPDTGVETLTYKQDSLRGTEQIEMVFKVLVTEEASGTISNVAAAGGNIPKKPEPPETAEPETDEVEDKGETKTTAEPDVTIKKTVSPEKAVYLGDSITYTITLKNAEGAGQWFGSLRDSVPAGSSYLNSQASLTDAEGNETAIHDLDHYWDSGKEHFEDAAIVLSAGETYTLNFTVRADEYGVISNTASADGADKDGTPKLPLVEENEDGSILDGDSETVTTDVVPRPGILEIKKTVTNQEGQNIERKVVNPGDVLIYTITARNASETLNSQLSKLVITDKIPAGLIYNNGTNISIKDHNGQEISDSYYSITYQNGEIKVEFDDDYILEAGEKVEFSLAVTVDEITENKIVNTAKASAESPEDIKDEEADGPTIETSEDSAENILGPEVTITKKANKDKVLVGEDVTYTIQIKNKDGAGKWSGILTDALPEGSTYKTHQVIKSGNAAVTDSYNNGILTVDIKALAGGETVTIIFVVTANDQKLGASEGIINQATATGKDEDGNDADPEDSEEVETEVEYEPGELLVEKFVYSTEASYPFGEEAEDYNLNGKSIKTSDTLRYVIKLTNLKEYGKLELAGYTFIDELNQYLNYVDNSFTINGIPQMVTSNISGNNTILEYQFGSMELTRDTVMIAFDVTIAATASGEINNVAVMRKDNSSDESDETKNRAEYDLLFKKKVDQRQCYVGEELNYTIEVSNAEGAGLYEGTLTDDIPLGLDITKVTIEDKNGIADITAQLNGHRLEYDLILQGGENAIVTISAIAREEGNVENTALLTDKDGEEDKAISPPTYVGEPPKPEVVLEKEVDFAIAPPGEMLTYAIAVRNNGEGNWFGQIEDIFPDELKDIQILKVEGNGVYGEAGFGIGITSENTLTVTDIILKEHEYLRVFCTAVIKDGVENGTQIINVVSGEGEDANGDEHNPESGETATAIVTVETRMGELDIEKNIDSINADGAATPENTKAEYGDVISYGIKAGNSGDQGSILRNMVITDELPEGLALIPESVRLEDENGIDIPNGVVTINGQTIIAELKNMDIQRGQYVYLYLDAIVTTDAEEELINQVIISAESLDPAVEDEKFTLTDTASVHILVDNEPVPQEQAVYTVEYYYDGILDGAATEKLKADLGSTIYSITDKPKEGFYLDSVQGTPLVITKTEELNLIKVYYVSESIIQPPAEVYNYKVEYYYDGILDDTETITGFAEEDTVVDSYLPKLRSGYQFDHVEGLPLTITANEQDNVIRVYYVTDHITYPPIQVYGYRIEYYYDEVRNDSYTERGMAEADDQINSYISKQDNGYELDRVEGLPLTIATDEEANVIRIYYKPIPIEQIVDYRVEYYFDETLDPDLTEVLAAKPGTIITYYYDKIKENYELDRVEGLPLTIAEGGDNIIKVYYKTIPPEVVKDIYYYVVYYYNGVIDAELTERIQAEAGDEITSYTDKLKTGYIFSEVKNFPLKVTDNETDNIIEVFYISPPTKPEEPGEPGEPTEPTEPEAPGDGEDPIPGVPDRNKETGKKPPSIQQVKGDPKTVKSNVKTGDDSSLLLYLVGFMLSLAVAATGIKKRKPAEQNNEL